MSTMQFRPVQASRKKLFSYHNPQGYCNPSSQERSLEQEDLGAESMDDQDALFWDLF